MWLRMRLPLCSYNSRVCSRNCNRRKGQKCSFYCQDFTIAVTGWLFIFKYMHLSCKCLLPRAKLSLNPTCCHNSIKIRVSTPMDVKGKTLKIHEGRKQLVACCAWNESRHTLCKLTTMRCNGCPHKQVQRYIVIKE